MLVIEVRLQQLTVAPRGQAAAADGGACGSLRTEELRQSSHLNPCILIELQSETAPALVGRPPAVITGSERITCPAHNAQKKATNN